ncbi:antitoxin [Azorhizobium oxalatiphilum]|uniref:Antitoxin n=1 Tax=Azorhizobium oxalatiphilum TaxID=980631 RepID=A0A917CAE7_9HYPH|nr:type II toxin-antitoxin system Phd/YefM family antitoxin [Azorhizobium oxalatiphilum]GGF79318.1 antitoxin [Azorhizobium oxalatiphilum]
MREIQLRSAKENLSQVVDEAVSGDPVVITRHGKPEVVVVSWEEWNRVSKAVPGFGWLLAHPPAEIEDIPERRSRRPRQSPEL